MSNMPNQNIGLRLDADLLAAIDAIADSRGSNQRSAVIVDAIKAYLGKASGSSVEQRLADVEQRLNNVEQTLGSTVKQRPTLPNQTPAPTPPPPTAAPPPAPKQPREDAQQGAVSDATLRRRWEKAGRPSPGFLQWAEAEGWRGEGASNRRKWYPPVEK